MTLLPGLMDLHSHLFLHPYNEALWDDQVLKEPVAYRSILAAIHARDTLLAGFTLLRDLGTEGAGFSDLSIQRAIREGLIPGPRLQVATKAIVATASYAPGPRGYAENVILPKGAQEASGIPEILKAVREQAGAGADSDQGLCRFQQRSPRQRSAHLQPRGVARPGRGSSFCRAPRLRSRRDRRGHAPRHHGGS